MRKTSEQFFLAFGELIIFHRSRHYSRVLGRPSESWPRVIFLIITNPTSVLMRDHIEFAVSSLMSLDLLVEYTRYEHSYCINVLTHDLNLCRYRWRASRPGDAFDRRLKNHWHEYQLCRFSRFFKFEQSYLFLLSAGFCVLSSACWTLVHASSMGTTTIENVYVDGWLEPYSFEMNQNGCPLSDTYNATKVMNGGTLKLKSLDLLGKGNGGVPRMVSNSTGLVVAASDWRWTSRSVRFLSTTMTPRETITFDYRPPWPWYFEHVLVWFLIGVCLSGAGVSGKYCTTSTIQRATICGCVLLACVHLIAMAGYVSLRLFREASFAAAQTSLWIFSLVAFIPTSAFFEEVLCLLGAAALLVRGVSDCLVFGDCENLTVTPPTVEVAMLFLGCLLVAFKYQQLLGIIRRMEPEMASYNAAWQNMLAREGVEEELRRLDAMTLRATGLPLLPRTLCSGI